MTYLFNTEQEVLDHVREYFSRPGAQLGAGPEGDIDACAYRTLSGHACAIGCLIPDKNYSEDFEGKSVSALLPLLEGMGILSPDISEGFLLDLQMLHDDIAILPQNNTVENFLSRLSTHKRFSRATFS